MLSSLLHIYQTSFVLLLTATLLFALVRTTFDTPPCMTIFSHRGRIEVHGKPHLLLSERHLLSAYERGVRAFDVDLIWTSDGHLFVGHPSDVLSLRRLRHQPKVASAFEWSTSELEAAASPPPLRVTRLLELASTFGDNLTLALDLKGGDRAGFRDALNWLHKEVIRRRLQSSVWLWVASRAEAKRLRMRESLLRSPQPSVRLGKPLYDVGAPMRESSVDCSDQLQDGDADTYAFLGPSVSCANPNLFKSVNAAPFFGHRLGWLVWVVDDDATAHALLSSGVRAIISNVPLHMSEYMQVC